MLEKLLTFKDLQALQIVLSRSSLHRQVKAGKFPPPIKLANGQIRWKEPVIEGLIEEREKGV